MEVGSKVVGTPDPEYNSQEMRGVVVQVDEGALFVRWENGDLIGIEESAVRAA